jgi:precorrin-2 C(20)-methyltransferase
VIEQDAPGDYFYIIKEGRCLVTRSTPANPKGVKLATLTVGDSFGEEALISDSARNATVTMLTNGSLMRLNKEDFNSLLNEPLLSWMDYEEARQVVEAHVKGKEIRELEFPMVRERETLERYHELAREEVLKELERGRKVVFATLGDPTLYSTFGYLVEKLKGEAEVEAVPGVSAITACPASEGRTLAAGREKLAIVPQGTARLDELVREFETVVVVKVRDLKGVREELKGLEVEARVFSECGETRGSRDLAEASDRGPYLSLVLIRRR